MVPADAQQSEDSWTVEPYLEALTEWGISEQEADAIIARARGACANA